MVSPAGNFLPLVPVRQQHHRQLCQLQGSEHPHNPAPAGIAVTGIAVPFERCVSATRLRNSANSFAD